MKAEISIIDKNGNRFVGTVELVPVKGSKQKHISSMPEKVTGKKLSLPEHILKLRDSGFFSKPKTAKEVHTKLQGSYHCILNRVEVALVKLQQSKKLRKTKTTKKENNKTKVAYVW